MDRLAKRQVILFWFAGNPSWEKIRAELYPRIYGREHVCHPMSDVLYNLLYSLGIYVSVQVLEGTNLPRIYESMEDGISNIRESLGLSDQEMTILSGCIWKAWGEERDRGLCWRTPQHT
ncbi:MAG: hypothetical protein A4E47_00060 [Methanosaeta sp. PtaU1.Bin028]|nr:MAG: hypothetical protein A4E47_00060 [Methanosaeta sp. PtaU1.Bin028]